MSHSVLDSLRPSRDHSVFAKLEKAALDGFAAMREGSVRPAWSVNTVQQRIDAIDFSEPVGLEGAVDEALELMTHGDLLSASARCFGYYNPTAGWPGAIGDFLVAMRNPQLAVLSHAPTAVTIERKVIRYFLDQMEFPRAGSGHFTSGGSEANAAALHLALMRAEPRFDREGARAFDGGPTLYASRDSHLAWIKICRAAGLGTDAVRLVDTTGDGRIDPAALDALIRADRAAGKRPVLIAATAGTTGAGMIDPLHACRVVADEHGLSLHVDAAWAGALVLDPTRRELLVGIENADSVTIDAHKWLSVPMGAGMFFTRDADLQARSYAVSTGYMPTGDGADPYITTNQWSRRFIGIRLWMMLRTIGPQGYREIFDRHFALADTLRQSLAAADWTIRNDSPLPVIVFDDPQSAHSANDIAAQIEAEGDAWLGRVRFEGRDVLRACITSFLTTEADIELLIDQLDTARRHVGAVTVTGGSFG
ncbi:MAG: pyridoxal-dependent decarboxylase [Acidobacteriota bacterium]